MEQMQQIHDELASYDVFFLSTIDGDTPTARPLGLHMMHDGKEYFGVGTFKAVWAQLQANPRFSICACKGPRWFRMTATAEFTEDPAVVDAAFEAMPELRGIYNEQTGYKMGTFTFKDVHAEFIPQMMGAETVLEF